MGIIKVDPFRGFDTMMRRVNEVFDDVQRGGIRFEVGDFAPRVDISDDDKALMITAELPGINKEDVKITMQNNVLTIRLHKPAQELGGVSEIVLTFAETTDNLDAIETGAFRVFGDKLTGGNA